MSDSVARTSPTGRRVLVVEDEYYIADDLARELRLHGHEVIGPLCKREQVLRTLAANSEIDLAVIDINLHGQASYAIADALLARGVPFVFATGYARSNIPQRYAQVPLLEKPLDYAAFIRTVETLGALPPPTAVERDPH
jgi:CheY-like chemotaxis protein